MAILEVCGFNHWLLKKLEEYGCKEIVLMQPDKTSNKKAPARNGDRDSRRDGWGRNLTSLILRWREKVILSGDSPISPK
jgi:hypothetical protein